MFKWTENNLFHLSVGAVIQNGEGKILVHRLARIENKIFLPKKTHKEEMSLEQTLERVEAETGLKVQPERFLGSRNSTFSNESGQIINKTTLYFLCKILETTQRDPRDRDADSELMWLDREEAISIMRSQGKTDNEMDESMVLERLNFLIDAGLD